MKNCCRADQLGDVVLCIVFAWTPSCSALWILADSFASRFRAASTADQGTWHGQAGSRAGRANANLRRACFCLLTPLGPLTFAESAVRKSLCFGNPTAKPPTFSNFCKQSRSRCLHSPFPQKVLTLDYDVQGFAYAGLPVTQLLLGT